MNNKPFLLSEKEISRWVYRKCNREWKYDLKSLITDSEWAYKYCLNINNDPKIRKYITDIHDAVKYYNHISKEDKRINRIIGY